MRDSEIDAAVDKCLNAMASSGQIKEIVTNAVERQGNGSGKISTQQMVVAVSGALFRLSSELLRTVLKELL